MNIEMEKAFYYRVQVGDKLESLMQKFNTCKENILRNNSNIPLYAGEWIYIKQNEFVLHFVKPMETLDDIVKKYNTTIEKIKEDNNLKTEKLFIGQQLKIK